MGLYKIIDGNNLLTNLYTNPSSEAVVNGVGLNGASIALANSINSISSPRGIMNTTVTTSATNNSGWASDGVALTSGLVYIFAVDLFLKLGSNYRLKIATTAGEANPTSTQDVVGNGAWKTYYIKATAPSTANYSIYVRKNVTTDLEVFAVDGLVAVNVSAAAYAEAEGVTYIDGDQDGCKWSGAAHSSQSYTDALSRNQGLIIDLNTLGAYVLKSPSGLGLINHDTGLNRYAAGDGSYIQRSSIPDRVAGLPLLIDGTSKSDLHAKRARIAELLYRWRGPVEQPFGMLFTGGPAIVRGDFIYDTGFSFNNERGFNEESSVRFIGPDPFWYGQFNDQRSLSRGPSLTSIANTIWQVEGFESWAKMGSGLNSAVLQYLVVNPSMIFACGNFTLSGASAVEYLARFDGSAWNATDNAGLNAQVSCMALGWGSTIYFGGNFTAGGAPDRIAKMTIGIYTLQQIGTETVNATVNAIAVNNRIDLCLYGGAFTNFMRAFRPSTEANVSIGTAPNAAIRAIKTYGSKFIVGGSFTNVATKIGIFDPSNNTWVSLATTMSGAGPDCIEVAPNGDIYVGGDLGTVDGVVLGRIGLYKNGAWYSLGGTLNGNVKAIKYIDGVLYCGGVFTSIIDQGVTLPDSDGFGIWVGGRWISSGFNATSGTVACNAIEQVIGNRLVIDFSQTTCNFWGIHEFTVNGGAEAYPIIALRNPGSPSDPDFQYVSMIRNVTTGRSLYCDRLLQKTEVLTLDLRPGKRSYVSSRVGAVAGALRGSAAAQDLFFARGTNRILVATNAFDIAGYARWVNRYPGFDTRN